MTVTIPVRVREAYDVHVGVDLLPTLPNYVPSRQVLVVTDEHVARHHLQPVVRILEDADRRVLPFIVPAREASKSVRTWEAGLRQLASNAFGRDDVVLALGGGVVGDLAGFLAASYARGLPFVHVPTSLLAMADAAVGGKTGINLPEGKNLVGAFWQPRVVLMDVGTLATLPSPVFDQGLVEMVKHGLLADPDLIDPLLAPDLSGSSAPERLTSLVAASVRVKAEVVANDEREDGTARATLNLGHTVAHALEAITHHELSHGEAVAWGLLYAALLSARHPDPAATNGSNVPWDRIVMRLLHRIEPKVPPSLAWDDVVPYVARDKKNRGGGRRWILADAPGRPRIAADVPEAQELDAWHAFTRLVDSFAGERVGEGDA